jgi:uncharacterized protein (UPF0128 family)
MRREGHIAHMGEKSNAYRVLMGKPEGKNKLEVLRIDGRIILKLVSEDGRIRTGLIWLRLGTMSRLLGTW